MVSDRRSGGVSKEAVRLRLFIDLGADFSFGPTSGLRAAVFRLRQRFHPGGRLFTPLRGDLDVSHKRLSLLLRLERFMQARFHPRDLMPALLPRAWSPPFRHYIPNRSPCLRFFRRFPLGSLHCSARSAITPLSTSSRHWRAASEFFVVIRAQPC